MLLKLHISKYALIDNTDIDFYPGFSVITGETGAGKSILLGAINLLLGERADVRVIKAGAQKCVVEAVFKSYSIETANFFRENDLDFVDGECIIRREISSSGKSRAFINDTPVTLSQMKELGRNLIDIHSQHQNLLLKGSDFQLSVLDCVAENFSMLSKYKEAYGRYKKCAIELASLKEAIRQKQEDEDYLRYQLEQFDEAWLKDGEQEELEQEQQKLSHIEEIKETLSEVCNAFDNEEQNVTDLLSKSSQQLSRVSKYYPEAQPLSERMDSVGIELKDIIEELKSKLDYDDYDPSRLKEIDERLSLIYDLERKHKLNSIAELILKADKIREQISLIDDADEIVAKKEKEFDSLEKQLREYALKLSASRKKAAKVLSGEMQRRLAPLGMPDLRFEIEIKDLKELSYTGTDNVKFLFSANKNAPLRDISEIASGGEVARVMLCLKAILSNVEGCSTIVFDEIDTGVSGRIAEQMACTMQEMSQGSRQVISITHLPQIAAYGKYHYHVYKTDEQDTTISKIELLSPEQRINEIAYMLSGKNITDAAVKNAKELLENRIVK